jgi:hypothetical protein
MITILVSSFLNSLIFVKKGLIWIKFIGAHPVGGLLSF